MDDGLNESRSAPKKCEIIINDNIHVQEKGKKLIEQQKITAVSTIIHLTIILKDLQ